MTVVRRALRAALAVNGLTPPPPRPPLLQPVLSPARCASLPAVPARQRDRVIVLGLPGVLVRVRNGRLPRDNEVEVDGACLRFEVKGGHVLLAGALRRRPEPRVVRWATAAELSPAVGAVVRAVAPAAFAELENRQRIAGLARAAADLLGFAVTGDPETDLRAVLTILQRGSFAESEVP